MYYISTGKIDTIREEQMVEHLAPGSTIEVMRCGAHTVNLVIKDSIKQMNCETNLREIRKVVKRSKAIVFRPIFQIHNAPVPVLDCDTRWGTTPIMVDSFLQLVLLEKQIQTVDPKYNIEKSLIRFAEEFCKAFKPMVTLLKNLQKGQLTVGDLYRYYWIEARIALQKLRHTNSFASALIENLSKRKDKLFENKTFLAGLFMDPRFNFKDTPYLTSEQKNIAIVSIYYVCSCEIDCLHRMSRKRTIRAGSPIPVLRVNNSTAVQPNGLFVYITLQSSIYRY